MKVKIKRLHEDAIIPKYATIGSSGFDISAIEDTAVFYGHSVLVKTGLSIQVPQGYELQIRQRSGLSLKTQLRLSNGVGTIDSDYTGEIMCIMTLASPGMYLIKKGDRIAQGIICPVIKAEFEQVDSLVETDRSDCGFGSTGI